MLQPPNLVRTTAWVVTAVVIGAVTGCRHDATITLAAGSSGPAASSADSEVTGDVKSTGGNETADAITDGMDDVTGGQGTGTSSSMTATSGPATESGSDATQGMETGGSGGGQCELPEWPRSCDGPDRGSAFGALGLGCTNDPREGVVAYAMEHANSDFGSWRVVSQFGNAGWSPREGAAMLLLSTGQLPAPDPPRSRVVMIPSGLTDDPDRGANANPDGLALPAPIRVDPGSDGPPFENCDGINDCSETLQHLWDAERGARDLQWLRFRAEVPPGVRSFRMDVAWFSAEFPRRMDRQTRPFDDAFVVWVSGRAYTGNLAVTSAREAANSWGFLGHIVTGGGYLPDTSTALLNTGFQGSSSAGCSIPGWDFDRCPRGASTAWLELAGPVEPGDSVEFVVALFDQGDEQFDTMVLLDNFRWSCESCRFASGCAGMRDRMRN